MAHVLLLFLSACTPPVPRTETETPPTQEKIDLAECRQRMEVAGPRPPGGGGPAGVFAARAWQSRRQQVFEDCMRIKGYREAIP